MARFLKALSMLTVTSIAAMPVMAGTDSGFYLGASVGNSEADYSDDGLKFDDSDTGYKVFAGYNLGLVPLLDLAVELSYVDFGEHADEVESIDVSTDTDALTVAAIVGTNIGPVGVFAKAGVVDWDADYKVESFSESDSGTDALYGLGAKLQFGSIGVRAEYERYDFDELEIDLYSVGAVLVF